MRFLICDNNISYRSQMIKKLNELIQTQFMIIETKSAIKLESAIHIDQKFTSQVIIMDHDFCDDAINIARMLVMNNKGVKIIFTGTKAFSSYDGLEPHIAGFIKKPISNEQFLSVLHQVIEDYNRRNVRFKTPVRHSHYYETFWVNDIRSIFTYYNDLEIILCNGEKRDCHVKSRYHIRNALGCRWFLRINEHVMVNMNEIEVLTHQLCIMKTNEVYKVSQVYFKQILKKYEIFNRLKRQGYYVFEKDETTNILKTSYPRPTKMF